MNSGQKGKPKGLEATQTSGKIPKNELEKIPIQSSRMEDQVKRSQVNIEGPFHNAEAQRKSAEIAKGENNIKTQNSYFE